MVGLVKWTNLIKFQYSSIQGDVDIESDGIFNHEVTLQNQSVINTLPSLSLSLSLCVCVFVCVSVCLSVII